MRPIFNELILMWKELGFDIPISEGKYWLNNNFVCGFNRGGQIDKLFKYKVYDDLTINITPYKNVKFNDDNYETWKETIERYSPILNAKICDSHRIIKQGLELYPNHKKVILNSTGKDSMVVWHIVKNLLPETETYFNNTTLDVADTYKMVKGHSDWNIINPHIGFYNYIVKENFIPTRFSRGCCTVFKEGESINYFQNETQMFFFMGIRNDESNERADREDFIYNPKWGKRDWIGCLPIRKWSELDVWLYTLKNNLEINPKYKKGYSRVGCGIACPYYTKYTWVLDKYWYRNMYDRWRNKLRNDFITGSRWCKCNSTIDEYVNKGWNGGLFRAEPNEEVIKEFMEYKGLDSKEVALKYFNNVCCVCGKNVRQSDVLGMNLKLHGRDVKKIFCKKHLKQFDDISEEKWIAAVRGFKAQGCKLF